MTLIELKQLTENAFAHAAYQYVDDEPTIVGTWCRCTYIGNNHWDVWICDPNNIASGLSQRKVTGIHSSITRITRRPGPYRVLTGEAIYLAMPTSVLIESRLALGIPKRRAISPDAGRKFTGTPETA